MERRARGKQGSATTASSMVVALIAALGGCEKPPQLVVGREPVPPWLCVFV